MKLSNSTWKTTIDDYRQFIFSYGIISVLNVLEILEAFEVYEECKKIIDAINRHNELVGFKHLDTRLDYLNTLSIKSYFKEQISDDELFKRYEYYTQRMLDDIREINSKKETKLVH